MAYKLIKGSLPLPQEEIEPPAKDSLPLVISPIIPCSLKIGDTVVRKIRPNTLGIVTFILYTFGTIKQIKEVYVKFHGKDVSLPYQPIDLQKISVQ